MPRAPLPRSERLAVVILAGGQASRLPRKLELDAGGVPLVVRVYRNLRDAGSVYVSAAATFPPDIDRVLECPLVIDEIPRRGPLSGLYSTLPYVRAPWVFAVAADAPFVTADVADELARAWERGVQAVVPENRHGVLQPLCALYERGPLLEAAAAVLAGGSGSVAAAVERLRAKRVRLTNERVFANVNTASDRTLLKA